MVHHYASEPNESRLSSSYSDSAGADAMRSFQWRPRSAPKTSSNDANKNHHNHRQHHHHKSANPFQLWGRRDSPPRPGDRAMNNLDADFFVAISGKESDDPAYVDSVSNHLGKMTPSTTRPDSSSTQNDRRDWADSAVEVEGQGPPPSITREEYMSLPLAIQRKYFSVLERLHFGETEERIFNHYDRKHRPNHSSPGTLPPLPPHREHHECHAATTSDASWLIAFHDRISKADLTREEQVNLIKHLRASVIIEAANEASRNSPPTPDIDHSTATLSSRRGSMDSMASAMEHQLELNGRDPMRQSLYDSFRWLDEEEDLDLGLALDEYHANLRDDVPHTSKNSRPSFRRNVSISKLPFGLPPITANQPGNKDSPTSPPLERPQPNLTNNQRRLSRTLSIMNPSKHIQTEASPSVDPTAAHYQDPDARQKLRAYLSSPSKFDEAVEYGFPATDCTQRTRTYEIRGHTRPSQSDGSEMRSFLDFDRDEDDGSGRDDASSLSDPDSPKTPQTGGLTPPPGHHRPVRSPTDPLSQFSSTRRTALPYKATSSDASSREMTLRMTLTRPDLRANEELIYGWQPQAAYINTGRKSQSNPARSEPAVSIGRAMGACWSDQAHKMDVESTLAELDHWNPDSAAGDKSVMKRFWNKVRRT